jgi:hypothetical protein
MKATEFVQMDDTIQPTELLIEQPASTIVQKPIEPALNDDELLRVALDMHKNANSSFWQAIQRGD